MQDFLEAEWERGLGKEHTQRMRDELRRQLQVMHPLDDVGAIFLIDAQHLAERKHRQFY